MKIQSLTDKITDNSSGSSILAILCISVIVLTIGAFTLNSIIKNHSVLEKSKGVSQREAVLKAIVSRSKFDLSELYCKKGKNIDSLFTEFSKSNPKSYGKGAFQVFEPDSNNNGTLLFSAPENNPRVFVEKLGTEKLKLTVKTILCKLPVPKRVPANSPDSNPLNDPNSYKNNEWNVPCPPDTTEHKNKENVEYISYVDKSELEPCKTKKTSCRVVPLTPGGVASCAAGEKLVGGGCSSAMDGCHPNFGSDAYVAIGDVTGRTPGSASAICCSQAGALDLNSQLQQFVQQTPNSISSKLSCPPGKIALGAGWYRCGGWDGQLMDDVTEAGTRVSTRAYLGKGAKVCKILWYYQLCYNKPPPGTIYRHFGPGRATCDRNASDVLLAGRWSGYPGGPVGPAASGFAYPQDIKTFVGPGLVTAICLNGEAN